MTWQLKHPNFGWVACGPCDAVDCLESGWPIRLGEPMESKVQEGDIVIHNGRIKKILTVYRGAQNAEFVSFKDVGTVPVAELKTYQDLLEQIGYNLIEIRKLAQSPRIIELIKETSVLAHQLGFILEETRDQSEKQDN